jgi:hypothetical protein
MAALWWQLPHPSQNNSDWGSAADPRLAREKSISVVVVVVVVVYRVEMFDDEELETEYRWRGHSTHGIWGTHEAAVTTPQAGCALN